MKKINITTDDFRLGTNLTTTKTNRFTRKPFFYSILRFTHSHLGVSVDIGSFVQLIQGSYKSDKPNNNNGIDEIHKKYDCFNGSIVSGVREPILWSLALEKPPGHKIYKEN